MIPDLVLNDRYRLLEQLATGGMGEVWRAWDEVLARPVAVKLLREELVVDATARDRFQAEARFAAALTHSGIAQVYDFGEQAGRAYLVMELVQGEPLSKILLRTGALAPEVVLDLIGQAARALAAAHAAGIVHRDVKPGNLMVTTDGTVKITDFGIARDLQAGSSQTQPGMVMATAHYISPEQASGQEVSAAADLYSLGVVAFECLTGRAPFDAETPVAVAHKHVRDAPPELPPTVPTPVKSLIGSLLAKTPQARPRSADEAADRAQMIRDTLVLQPVSPDFDGIGPPDTLTQGTARRRAALLYASVAAGVLLLGAIGTLSMWRGFSSADLVRDGPGDLPVVRPSGGGVPEPGPAHPAKQDVGRPVPTSGNTPATRRSTPAVPGASSSPKPSSKPIRETSTAPEPTPTPTESTTTPSTPTPVPSPTDSGGLGSEDKA